MKNGSRAQVVAVASLTALVFLAVLLFNLPWNPIAAAQGPGPYKVFIPFVPRADVVSNSVRVIAVDPMTPTTLYVVPNQLSGTVFKSTDGGVSWHSLYTGLTGLYEITSLAIDPVTPTTLYLGENPDVEYPGTAVPNVLKSTDGGATWAVTDLNLKFKYDQIVTFAIDPQTPTNVYAGTGVNGVLKSTDGGKTFSMSNSGFLTPSGYEAGIDSLAIDPVTPTTLYASASMYVFKSTDGGATWQSLFKGLPDPYGVMVVVVDPRTPTTVYAGGTIGIYKSTDAGATWSAVNAGLPSTPNPFGLPYIGVNALLIDPVTPTNLYASVSDSSVPDGVYKSGNGGATWAPANNGLPVPCVGLCIMSLAIDPHMPTTLYAGLGIDYGTGPYKTTNGAISWSAMNWPPP